MNFKILGVPQPKQSFKFAIRHNKDGGQYVSKYQDGKVLGDEKDIVAQIVEQLPRNHVPWKGGVMIRIQYVFSPPNAFSKKSMERLRAGEKFYKTTKPDQDNLDKALFDAMQGRVFINDSQICSRLSEKVYGEIPRTEISMKHL